MIRTDTRPCSQNKVMEDGRLMDPLLKCIQATVPVAKASNPTFSLFKEEKAGMRKFSPEQRMPLGNHVRKTGVDLADMLKCHVATGAKEMSEDLKAMEQMVGCLQGSELTVTVEGGKVEVNDASVTAAGVNANSSAIHAIDKVLLLPSGPRGTAGTAVTAGSFTTLAAALTRAGLAKSFQGAGPFAVFTPIDKAMQPFAVYAFTFPHVGRTARLPNQDVILGDLVESDLEFWWALEVSEMLAMQKYSEDESGYRCMHSNSDDGDTAEKGSQSDKYGAYDGRVTAPTTDDATKSAANASSYDFTLTEWSRPFTPHAAGRTKRVEWARDETASHSRNRDHDSDKRDDGKPLRVGSPQIVRHITTHDIADAEEGSALRQQNHLLSYISQTCQSTIETNTYCS